MKKTYKVTHTEKSSANKIIVFYKDGDGNDVPVELKKGEYIYIEYEVLPSLLRVYEKKGIVTTNSHASSEGFELNRVYEYCDDLEEIEIIEDEDVLEGEIMEGELPELVAKPDESEELSEEVRIETNDDSIVDSAKEETKKYSKKKKKRKKRVGRPKKRGPKKGSLRKKK